MAGYLGSVPVPQATQHRETFTCTEGQTTFNTAGYTPQFVDVYLNGSHLSPADFTASNGSDVVLGVAASADDVCDIVSYTPFEVANQTFTGTTTMTDVVAASLDISGDIDIDGTTNLDIVDIDGAVNIATTALVTGILTTTAATVFNGGFASNAISTIKTASSGVQPLLTLLQTDNTSGNTWGIDFKRTTGSASEDLVAKIHANREGGDATGITFSVNKSNGTFIEAARFDSSGNWLVGKTSFGNDIGCQIETAGVAKFVADGSKALIADRNTNDGNIIELRKDATNVGILGTIGDQLYIGTDDTGLRFLASSDAIMPVRGDTGASVNDVIDLGIDSARFDNIFATNGTIDTSDQNEKQDIAALTSAEMLVAKRISALFKTFKWKARVADKGDAARTHSGIIAQDVQAAFEAESLDAGNYALFTSGSWWEHDVDVAAVEADDTVEPAIKAADAYTRTDEYYTEDEAPSGSTKRTRLGIRYTKLLSFLAAYNEQRFAAIETRLTALEG